MIGVLGGSGFYNLIDDARREHIKTPFGEPSGDFAIGSLDGQGVVFLPRHGSKHTIPPAQINCRANLWAMKKLGVTQVIAPTASGSLQADIKPGDVVVTDQFVDRTYGRPDTFFTGPRVGHVSAADPYCPRLRGLALATGRELGVTMHDGGTVVVVNGPRFSTRAESRWFAAQGWQVVNMTQYPEVILARELELCYLNMALITDYDSGLEGSPGVSPVTVADVQRLLKDNNEKVRELIVRLISKLASAERDCPCPTAMEDAFIGG
ncbi:MAG: S-methyl-5'-thioadenosine phosphorylase [Candidatus Dormibacteraeota bacterium]|nr:S-methyl-5'-thioadenosine phosphorylase [Candidatus Dormibacteraeota bacterium]